MDRPLLDGEPSDEAVAQEMRETLHSLSIYDEDAHVLPRPPGRSFFTYMRQFASFMYSDFAMPTMYWHKLTWENVKKDMVVGFTLACVLIPQGLSYASIALVPSVYGLYASFVPNIIFGVLGSDKFISFGPFALMSLLVGAALSDAGYEGCGDDCDDDDEKGDEYVEGALALALCVGLLHCAMVALRLGSIAYFLADPVLKGYTTAAAFLIGASQLGKFFQIDMDSNGSFVTIMSQLFNGIDETNGYSVLVGILTMAMIWGAQKYINSKPRLKSMGIPIHLLIMIFWIIITYAAQMNDEPCNVSIVGKIPAGLPKIGAPKASHIMRVFPHSIAVTVVSFMLNLSLLQVFASKYDYDADISQNLSAMGLANVVGSFFGSYPACSSLSRSALIDSIGGHSPLHSVVTGVLIMVVMLLLTSVFTYLPQCVLAAIIFMAVAKLIQFEVFFDLFKKRKRDAFLWACTFVATLFGGVSNGLIIGVSVSLVLLIYECVRPSFVILGKFPGQDIYRDITKFSDVEVQEGVVVCRYGSTLHFANRYHFDDCLLSTVQRYTKGEKAAYEQWLILDCANIYTMDTSASAVVGTTIKKMSSRGWKLALCECTPSFKYALARTGVATILEKCGGVIAPTIGMAIASIKTM